MLSHAPEYEWVYKHIGVAQTLRADGPDRLPEHLPGVAGAVHGRRRDLSEAARPHLNRALGADRFELRC